MKKKLTDHKYGSGQSPLGDRRYGRSLSLFTNRNIFVGAALHILFFLSHPSVKSSRGHTLLLGFNKARISTKKNTVIACCMKQDMNRNENTMCFVDCRQSISKNLFILCV